ncbi:MAG TPA: enoyl-CoA hydratase-related protein [Burkholderiales bacterium]|nr:enoyl-CoA hydratase-related protein [Burkholderiales bacterium]
MSGTVISQIDKDGNATVMLNRPEVHNAFDPGMVAALTKTLKKLEADRSVRAVVLLGAGKSFCAGADIAHMKKSAGYSAAQNFKAAQQTARMLYTLYRLEKPTIACIHGAVRGGGVGLAAACDIAIASRAATFRLSEVKLGVIPAMISPYVIAAIGERMAHRYMLTGEEFDAAEAFRIGLVHGITDDDKLGPVVSDMLSRLYSSGPDAVVAIKRLIPVSAHAPIGDKIVDETARRIARIRATKEAQEGLSAFLEKRKPAWLEAATEKTPKTAKRKGR